MSSNLGEQIAKPHDPDLDLDVDALYVQTIIANGTELFVTLSGGLGEWADSTTCEMIAVDDVTDCELVAMFAEDATETVALYVQRLNEWYANQTPLRVCGAPDRMFTVIADRDNWLPFPRRTLEE